MYLGPRKGKAYLLQGYIGRSFDVVRGVSYGTSPKPSGMPTPSIQRMHTGPESIYVEPAFGVFGAPGTWFRPFLFPDSLGLSVLLPLRFVPVGPCSYMIYAWAYKGFQCHEFGVYVDSM